MAEANFDIDPIAHNANTPELDLDVEMEDSGNERGEANFITDIEVLDALYLLVHGELPYMIVQSRNFPA